MAEYRVLVCVCVCTGERTLFTREIRFMSAFQRGVHVMASSRHKIDRATAPETDFDGSFIAFKGVLLRSLGGATPEHAPDLRSRWRQFQPRGHGATTCDDPGQVVHTHLPRHSSLLQAVARLTSIAFAGCVLNTYRRSVWLA